MRASEWIEVQCLRSLFSVPDSAGVFREAGDALSVRVDGVPGVELNRIVGMSDLSHLGELAAVYGDQPYWVALDPEAGLDRELMARGFVPDGAWQKFERGVEPIQSQTELEIAEARAPEDFADIVRTNWGVPPDAARWLSALVKHPDWRCYVAYDDGHPVAAGMLYAEGELGWLGVTSTRVEHRGRGAQGGILAARIDRARELGLSLLVTETGQSGRESRDPRFATSCVRASSPRTSARTTRAPERGRGALPVPARGPRGRWRGRRGRAQAQ